MTFNYMVYMLSTCMVYFFLILSAVHCEFSRLNMHKLSRTDADSHVLWEVSLYVPGLHLKWLWGPSVTLKLFVLIQSCYMQSFIILGTMVHELHAMRIVCLLKVITPAWGSNTILFLLVIDYIHHSSSFEILQPKVKFHLSVGPASPVPRALNKRYTTRGRLINVSFMYNT